MSRMYAIALFLFMVQLSISALGTMGIFTTISTADSPWITNVNSTNLQDRTFLSTVATAFAGTAIGDISAALDIFVNTMINALTKVSPTFQIFGVPKSLSDLFAAAVYFLWSITLVQFIRGVSFGGFA